MRIGAACVGLALLASCGETRGPLLHALGDAAPAREDAGGGASGASGTRPSLVAQDAPWQYQLVGTVDPELDARFYVIDLFNVSTSTLARLHAAGKRAAAYLSAGTVESFRDDAAQFPAEAIGRSLEAYPDESWLDVRNDSVRALMAARLDLARDKGFDGLLPTNLAAYRYDSGFDLSADDQLEYGVWLAEQARARGLAVGMAGDFAHGELADHFDFGVHFGCIAGGNCDQLAPLAEQGKPVLDVETEGDATEVCARAAELGLNAILKRPDYGAYRVGCQ